MKLACLKKNLSLLMLAFFLFVFSPRLISAQEAMSLTATPVRVGDDNSLLLKPGEKKQIQVKVKNNSQMEVNIESQVLDFIVGEDGSTPIPVTEEQSDRWSLANWITLVPAVNQLDAGDTAVINALIEVPTDAMPGGRYAMILHRPNTGEVEVTGSGVSQRVGTLIYVIVDGPINEEAYVSQFNVPGFLENGPVPVEIKIKNESDIHISPLPKLRIYNLFGQEIEVLTLDQKNIFPETERDFDTVWDRVWGFGPYTLQLEAAYGQQGQLVMAEAQLWLVPVKLIIISLLVILIIVTVVIVVKKQKNQTSTPTELDKQDETPVDEQEQQ